MSENNLREQQWERRAKAFQEGYRDKSFEVTALEIQLMDLRAFGADKVTARQNESLRTKLLAACIERNEGRQLITRLTEALAEIAELDGDDDNQRFRLRRLPVVRITLPSQRSVRDERREG